MYGPQLAEVYDAIYLNGRVKNYPAEAAALTGLIRARCPRAASLLDVACGTGAHLTYLRDRFTRVAGVELSPPMRLAAAAKLPDVPIHAGDMRTFDLGSSFDAVTCLFSSIGYLRGLDELHAAVARMVAHLNPGGVLLIEPWFTPEQWRDGLISHTVTQVDDRTIVRMGFSSRSGRRTSHMHMHYLVGESGTGIRQFVDEHVMTLFTTGEYEQALSWAGLTGIGWENGWDEGRDRLLARRSA